MKIAMTVGLLAIMLFSLGLPAFATTGQPGPTPPEISDPVTTTNEVQMVRLLGDANGGYFRLSLNGTLTADIPYNFRGSGGSVTSPDLEMLLEAINAPLDIVSVSISYGSSQGGGLRGHSSQVTFNTVLDTTNGNTPIDNVPDLQVEGASGTGAPVKGDLTGSRAVFGALNAAVGIGDTSMVVDEIVTPPAWPSFSVLIDGETLTATNRTPTATPGRYTYTLGAAATAAHAVGATVSSTIATPFVVVETAVNGTGPVTGQTSPHGGYSSVTDYCLQCHAVHAYDNGTEVIQPGPFALQMEGSVTETCATCHSLFGNASGTPVNSDAITGKPTIPGGMATTSLRSVYDLGDGQYLAPGTGPGSVVPGHELAAPEAPDGTVMEGEIGGASATQGGLYCGSCHTPHGDFGQLINSTFYRSEGAAGITNEIQLVTLTDPTTPGTFTLSWKAPDNTSGTTAAIAYGATAADVQTALEGLGKIDPGDVVVTATIASLTPPAVGFDVQFTGQYAGLNVNQMTITPTTFGSIGTTQAGGSPTGDLLNLYPFENNSRFLEGRSTWWYLWFDASLNVWLKCSALNGGGSCSTVTPADYLTTVDMEGQSVYLFGYKLLTSKPNSSVSIESWGMGSGGHDGARWCGTCHTAQMGSEVGGLYHSHPGSCTYCHGNPADGTSFDFPHTSTNGSLLKEYPDALCVTCHSKGSLP